MGLYCEVCDLHMSSEIVMRDHLKGKKHLRIAELQHNQKQKFERSIYVRAMPPHTTDADLRKYFQKFGLLKKCFLDPMGQYAFIEFGSRDSVAEALSVVHYMNSTRLIVKPRLQKKIIQNKRNEAKKDKSDKEHSQMEDSIFSDELTQMLLQAPHVEEQFRQLQMAVGLTLEDKQQRTTITDKLQQLFTAYMGECELQQFGSSVNGFGMRGCDMDLFLDLHLDAEVLSTEYCNMVPLPYFGNLKSIELDDGNISKAQMGAAENRDLIKLLSKILIKSCEETKQVFAILNARCPVVKFIHQPTGIECDLSLNNKLALRNTEYLRLMQDYEPRVQPLMYALRYWAKTKDLMATSGARLTGYSLAMMVYFYLQQLQPPILPSVQTMAQLADPEEKVVLEGWDCTFPKTVSNIPASTNKSSLQDLLHGFMTFYADFDLASHVICPRTAKSVDITTFRASADADDKLKGFKLGPVNIQDPFVLDHNTGYILNDKLRRLINLECRQAATRFEEEQFNVVSSDKHWGLLHLVSGEKAQLPPMSAAVQNQQIDYTFLILVHYLPAKLPERFFKSNSGHSNVKRKWVKEVCNLFHHLICNVLLFDVEVVKDNLQDTSAEKVPMESFDELYLHNEDCADQPDLENVAKQTENIAENIDIDKESMGRNANIDVEKEESKCVEEILVSKSEELIKLSDIQLSETPSSSSKRLSSEDVEDQESKRPCYRPEGSDNSEQAPHQSGEMPSDVCPFLATLDKISLSQPTGGASSIPSESMGCETSMASPDSLLSLKCRTDNRVWMGRKTVRKQLRLQEENFLALEKLVTEKVLASLPPADGLAVAFDVAVVLDENWTDTILQIRFQPTFGTKEFSSFYSFFKPMFGRAVDNCVYK